MSQPVRDETEPARQEDAVRAPVPAGTEKPRRPVLRRWRGRARLVLLLALLILAVEVVRAELVEGYQIPTHSMEPVLRGSARGGDKVLVFKKTFVFRSPRRWEMLVFRREGRPGIYVKRVVGLPGEVLRILDGDVYIDGHIASKPWSEQEEMLLAVYPGSLEREEIERFWKTDGDGEYEADGRSIRIPPGGGLRFHTREEVRDSFVDRDGSWVEGSNRVGDLMLDLELVPGTPQGRVELGLQRDADWFVLSLPVGEGCAALGVRPPPGPLDPAGAEPLLGVPPLRPGRAVRIRFSNIDRRLRVEVDGRVLYEGGYDPHPREAGRRRNEAFFGVERAGVEIRSIELLRDIYYTADGECGVEGPVAIPGGKDRSEGRYFMLGDNSARSYDSRFWGDLYEATVPHSHLIGTPFLIFWPPGRARILE